MPWITVQLPAGRTVQPEKARVAALARETSRARSRDGGAMQIAMDEVKKDNRGMRGVPGSAIFTGPPGYPGSGEPRSREPS